MAGVTRALLATPPAAQPRQAFRRSLRPVPPAAQFRGTSIKRFMFPPLGNRVTVRRSFL
jgi:hypothetical protein